MGTAALNCSTYDVINLANSSTPRVVSKRAASLLLFLDYTFKSHEFFLRQYGVLVRPRVTSTKEDDPSMYVSQAAQANKNS